MCRLPGGHHGLPRHGARPRRAAEAIAELGGERQLVVSMCKPAPCSPVESGESQAVQLPHYQLGENVAPRKAYGDSLKALGAARPEVVALDAEVSNST